MTVNVNASAHEPVELATWCCAPVDTEALRDDQAVALAEVFAALADPVRLRIFSLIASQGEVCSCNLEGPLQRSQPTISHHTSRLAAAGLIVGEKRGRWTWWRPVAHQLDEVARVLRVTKSFSDVDAGR
jgi:ArsR family transcriptional regulator